MESLLMAESAPEHEKAPESLYPLKHSLQAAPKQKRGPSTPLTPSVKQMNITRRKFEDKGNLQPQQLDFGGEDLLDLKYQNWILGRESTYKSDTIQFLELERKFTMQN
jgi:hypothetical protein